MFQLLLNSYSEEVLKHDELEVMLRNNNHFIKFATIP
jgi:hypothetical protein